MPSSDASTRALPTLHEFFSPGGILARSPLPFEYRPGQLEMAKAVERALSERRHLIVEAGTGTGKTLAYLLPALRTGQRVIVSTGTKALQDQLFFRDVPFLETLLGELRVCYMKGRANYLCRRKLFALRDQPILSGLDEIDEYRQIAEWEQITETGDRAELSALPESSALWHKLDARSDACLGSTCPDYRRCFITEMRRRALESDLIIVNHHLFFADAAVRLAAGNAPDAGVLPESAAVIFDEAHELEEVASQYFGRSLSNLRFEDLARDTDVLLRGQSSAPRRSPRSLSSSASARASSSPPSPCPLTAAIPSPTAKSFSSPPATSTSPSAPPLKIIEAELDRLTEVDEAPRPREHAPPPFAPTLNSCSNPPPPTWSSGSSAALRPAHRNSKSLPHAVVPAVAPAAVPALRFSRPLRSTSPSSFAPASSSKSPLSFSPLPPSPFRAASSTSAAVSASTKPASSSSPPTSNIGEQALLYLPPSMPDPREPDFVASAATTIERVLRITRGRAFCLFTSYTQMRALYERLLPVLDFPLLLHGTAPRKALLEEFRSTPNSVLFGTSSFWQGVDVQGEALSCVIIDRLPFAVPSDPVVQARMRAIEESGGRPFFDYQVPEAVLTLKQGFGRLIRSLEDRGVLVLLDPRITRQRYGQIFLQSLPPYRVTNTITDVESFFAPKPA